MKKYVIAAAMLSCLALGACMSNADIRMKLSAKCERYGHKPGTGAHAQCVDQLEQNLWASAAGMVNSNAALQNAQRPRQTYCTGTGITARCTTY